MKKTVSLLLAFVLFAAIPTTVFAAGYGRGGCYGGGMRYGGGNGYGYGGCGSAMAVCFSLMRDASGNFVDRDVFIDNLDAAITDGILSSADREFFISRYDFCIQNGWAPNYQNQSYRGFGISRNANGA